MHSPPSSLCMHVLLLLYLRRTMNRIVSCVSFAAVQVDDCGLFKLLLVAPASAGLGCRVAV